MFSTLNKTQRAVGIFALLIIAMIAIIITTMPVIGETLNDEEQPLALTAVGPNCRFGASPLSYAQGEKLSEIGAGWYLSFGSSPLNTVPADIQFVPMIRLKQLKSNDTTYLDGYTVSPALTDSELGAKIDANLGATWIVGNEPDRGPTSGSSGQDDMMPNMYARALHDVAKYIKDRDPSAKVASAGLVEITPGRIQYWEMVADSYYSTYNEPLPVDVWTMHLYAMPEIRPNGSVGDLAAVAVGTDPALGMRESGGNASLCGNVNNNTYCFADHDNVDFFERQIRDMRTWMKAHGQQYKPLLITEYSILYDYTDDGSSCFLQDEFGQCFTQARISNYLRDTFDLIDGPNELTDSNIGMPQDGDRLVQQVMWFSVYHAHSGRDSSLYNSTVTTTSAIGKAFQAEIGERSPLPNLLAGNAANVTGHIISPATTATVTLSADIYNNGDTATNSDITVTFYADEAREDPIGSDTISNLEGCANGAASVNVQWSGRPAGAHQYWVEANSDNSVVEEATLDNVTSGIVIINPDQGFVSTMLKK